MRLHLDLTKWFLKRKIHISPLRSHKRPLSFLEGNNGDIAVVTLALLICLVKTLWKLASVIVSVIYLKLLIKIKLNNIHLLQTHIVKTPTLTESILDFLI